MHAYQKTHMDETDVAKFDFRSPDAGMRSLAEFMDQRVSKDSDIYQAYIEAMKQEQEG